MESSPKRRKLDNGRKSAPKPSGGLAQHRLIDFEAPGAARISSASAFVLQADELLGGIRLETDDEALNGAVDFLHRLRSTIEAIEPHEPIAVRILAPTSTSRLRWRWCDSETDTDQALPKRRSRKRLKNSKRSTA
jgi:hypothetical protein